MTITNFSWFTLALIFTVLSSFNSILQKAAFKEDKVDPIAVSIYFPVLVSIMALPVFLFTKLQFTWDLRVWAVIILRSLMYLSGIIYFKVLKEIEVSQVTIISSTRALWIMFGGAIFLGEALTHFKMLGALCVILGIAVVYWRHDSFKNIGKPQMLMLLYAVILGITGIMDKYLVEYFDLASYQIIAFLLPSLVISAFVPRAVPQIKQIIANKYANLCLLGAAFIYNIAALSLFAALKIGGEASRVSPITQSATVLTVLFGIIFLNERHNYARKLAGATIVFLGIVLIKIM